MGAVGTKTNKLNRTEQRRLEDHVLAKKEAIEKGEYTPESFCVYYQSKVPNCVVTVGNVAGAAKVMKVAFVKRQRVSGMQNMKQLRATVKLLARELSHLQNEMGVHVSVELKALSES